MFPGSGFSKADVVRYYESISEFLLPHLRDRPMSFRRYPDTIHDESFWEKDAPGFTPAWVKRFPVPRRGEGEGHIDYILINDLRTLTWVAEIGGIELHPFLHVAPQIDLATHVVFDLDPGEGADILDCARVALLLRDALRTLNLESLAKVSGSKGIQVYVPLDKGAPHDVTEPFARAVADELARKHPKLIVSKMAKELRKNRVFIDWSQNAWFKTTIAVYSLRARTDPPLVSMPVKWEELSRAKTLTFEPDEAVARVKKFGDLFAPFGAPASSRRTPSGARRTGRQDAGVPLPKPGSQSGRRLFVLTKDELRLEMRGRFRRWILRGDVATPAGDSRIDPAYYRGEVAVRDSGAYEVIEGSERRKRFDLWFTGRVLSGRWLLEETGDAWRFTRQESRGATSSSGSTPRRPTRRAGTR